MLKEQLIDIEALAVDQGGKMLVWIGRGEMEGTEEAEKRITSPFPPPPTPNPQPPSTYTPAHLAERIRADQVALKPVASPMASARRSPPCLLISKVRPR